MRRLGQCVGIIGLVTLIICCQLHTAHAKPIRVAFLNPQPADDTFWKPVTEFMQAACEDLGIELTVYVADFNQMKMYKQAQEALSAADKPDFLVFKNFRQQAPKILQLAEDASVKSFIFNAGLLGDEEQKYGGPREQFPSWIGQMLPDDELAGYDLANVLIDEAQKKSLGDSEGRVHIVGITGNLADTPGVLRKEGLERAVRERNDVVLHQVIPGTWQQETAREKFPTLIKRFPETTVGWGANDPTSLGIIAAIKDLGKTPGQEMLSGGIDWTGEALAVIKQGEMTVSIGGHFMEGGWVMVLLYDYFHGIDFAAESVTISSRMSALTEHNLQSYLQYLGDEEWSKIDFTKFSKKLNPDLTYYDFSLDAILQQFK